MDIVDRAQIAEFDILENALQAQRLRAFGTKPIPVHHGRCNSCGCPIPEARQRAIPDCQYCLVCQLEIEEEAHHG
jgi:phage/conjugal plasmid C-4 type zinc finger TraR family protein